MSAGRSPGEVGERLQLPPSGAPSTAALGGEGKEAEKSPETQSSPVGALEPEARAGRKSGEVGAERRWWSGALQLLGDAVRGGERGGGGGALAWGAGRDKDQGSLLLAGHTPSVGQERRWRKCGQPRAWGVCARREEVPAASRSQPLFPCFVRDALAPQLSWIAPDLLPVLTPTLPHCLSCGFLSILPPLFTHSFLSKQYFLPSAGGAFANDRMPELVLTLNCLELLSRSLPPFPFWAL